MIVSCQYQVIQRYVQPTYWVYNQHNKHFTPSKRISALTELLRIMFEIREDQTINIYINLGHMGKGCILLSNSTEHEKMKLKVRLRQVLDKELCDNMLLGDMPLRIIARRRDEEL